MEFEVPELLPDMTDMYLLSSVHHISGKACNKSYLKMEQLSPDECTFSCEKVGGTDRAKSIEKFENYFMILFSENVSCFRTLQHTTTAQHEHIFPIFVEIQSTCRELAVVKSKPQSPLFYAEKTCF